MKAYNVLVTGSLGSGKYTLLSNLSRMQPQVKTFKFTDAQQVERVVDIAYQEVRLAEGVLCVYVMSDELLAAVQGFGFLTTMDAIILCVDADRKDAQLNLKSQLTVICSQGVGDRLSIRMKTSAYSLTPEQSKLVHTADQYHIAEELIEVVHPDVVEDVPNTVKSVLDFHLQDIIFDDALIA